MWWRNVSSHQVLLSLSSKCLRLSDTEIISQSKHPCCYKLNSLHNPRGNMSTRWGSPISLESLNFRPRSLKSYKGKRPFQESILANNTKICCKVGINTSRFVRKHRWKRLTQGKTMFPPNLLLEDNWNTPHY